MARFARVVAVDFPHHITHRGNRQTDVFLSDEDRLLYLRLLAQYGLAAQLDIWGYCLMSNHVHLIVVPRREDSLARGVGWRIVATPRFSTNATAGRATSGPIVFSPHRSTKPGNGGPFATSSGVEKKRLAQR